MADLTNLTTIVFVPNENAWSDGKTNCYEFQPAQAPVRSTPGAFPGQCALRNKVGPLTLLVNHKDYVLCGDDTGKNIYRFMPSEAPSKAALGQPVKVPLDCAMGHNGKNHTALPTGQNPVELVNYTGVHCGFGNGRWYVKSP